MQNLNKYPMQNLNQTNCIKISQTGKGLYHWEDQLLVNQLNRLNKILSLYNVNPWKKREIIRLFKKLVTRDNIIAIHSHPIQEFLSHLLTGNITKLETYSSSKA